MRVAITDFVSLANVGDHCFLWGPKTKSWQAPVPPGQGRLDWFHPKWGEILLRRNELWLHGPNPERRAVCFGSSKGAVASWAAWAEGEAPWPFCDGDARTMAAFAMAHGAVLSPVAACASGSHALALGAELIQNGQADIVLAGASEAPQPELLLACYRNMGALSKTGIMRPFDARRDGFIPASGGALLLLESEAHAQNRGAPIHGFLSGYSMKCDAAHLTSMSPSGDGIARAIEDALKRAGNPRIDYINAHGTATLNDAVESRAVQSVFGKSVPLSSTKPLTGHLLGAAGAVEAVVCLLAMRDGFAPPTLNLEERDSALDLDYIALHGREIEMDAVLSLNYGFGGHIGVLVFEKN